MIHATAGAEHKGTIWQQESKAKGRNLMDKNKTTAVIMNLCTGIGLIVTTVFIIYGIQSKIFTSQEALGQFLGQFGFWAPVLFVIIQIVQVVIPILPGAIGCLGGVLIFGPVWGFIYNYVGICLGSILAFCLSKRYGRPFVRGMVSEKAYDKYVTWLDKGAKFDKAFAIAIFLPVAPDDLLCYLAGLTKMTLKRFSGIILLGKPMSILLYSLGLTGMMELVKTML